MRTYWQAEIYRRGELHEIGFPERATADEAAADAQDRLDRLSEREREGLSAAAVEWREEDGHEGSPTNTGNVVYVAAASTPAKTLYAFYRGSSVDGTWTSDAEIIIVDATDQAPIDFFADRNNPIDCTDSDRLAEVCGLDGSLTEVHLLIYAIRLYGAVRQHLGLEPDTGWEPYSLSDLDDGEYGDNDEFCRAVEDVFGPEAGLAQREAIVATMPDRT